MVAVVFGVGTMGGVLTPTLLVGSLVGYLYGCGLSESGLCVQESVIAYAFVGMAAFSAVSGRALVRVLLLVTELSMSAETIFPLMLGVGVSYALGRVLPGGSLYDGSVTNGAATPFDIGLTAMRVEHLCRPLRARVGPGTAMDRVMRLMLHHPGENVTVQNEEGLCVGVVRPSLFLADASAWAGDAASATDCSLPRLRTNQILPEALAVFQTEDCNALPVEDARSGRLLGSLSRAELYQIMALMFRRELAHR